jgi:D-xylose 1-dehydrogenase (NADP+, D-xylono-1,5-lactone-forming)
LNRSLNWGVLGTAWIATDAVIPAIKASKNGKVVAIASRSQAKAEAVGRALGIPKCYSGYERLLDSPVVDAVYIPLPNGLHKEWVMKAAEKGKHVLCEKPISVNETECQEMIDACRKHNVLLMEAFMYLFHPQTNMLRKMLDEGILGKASLVRSSFTIMLSDLNDIRYQKNLGGGSLLDLGSYCVNATRMLLGGDPTEVSAMEKVHKTKGVDVAFAGLMRFKDDSIGLFDCGFESPYRNHLEVIGDKGTLEVPNPFTPKDRPTILLHNGETKKFVSQADNMYKLMAEHFSDCIFESREPAYAPNDSLRNMRLIDELVESAKSTRN